MTRIARVVAARVPHHITQRGNRRQRTFFDDEDYETYVRLMAASCAEHRVTIRAWCLMPNHVHLAGGRGLERAVGVCCYSDSGRSQRSAPLRSRLGTGRCRWPLP